MASPQSSPTSEGMKYVAGTPRSSRIFVIHNVIAGARWTPALQLILRAQEGFYLSKMRTPMPGLLDNPLGRWQHDVRRAAQDAQARPCAAILHEHALLDVLVHAGVPPPASPSIPLTTGPWVTGDVLQEVVPMDDLGKNALLSTTRTS